MTERRIVGFGLLAVVLAAGWAIGHRAWAQADRRPGQARWEYAQLYVRDGKAVFFEADRQSTINPPLNRLSGNVTRTDPSGERYTTATRIVRNHDVAALNLFGSQGWEAVSVVLRGEGLLVLLKRAR